MSLEGASDAELVRQFKSGDAAAYDAIVRRFQDRVFRLACVWLYDDQSAQDAAQEVFVRGFKGLRSFRFRSTPFTWLNASRTTNVWWSAHIAGMLNVTFSIQLPPSVTSPSPLPYLETGPL